MTLGHDQVLSLSSSFLSTPLPVLFLSLSLLVGGPDHVLFEHWRTTTTTILQLIDLLGAGKKSKSISRVEKVAHSSTADVISPGNRLRCEGLGTLASARAEKQLQEPHFTTTLKGDSFTIQGRTKPRKAGAQLNSIEKKIPAENTAENPARNPAENPDNSTY